MQTTNNCFKIDVKVSARVFRKFALFNVFVKQRRWISPSIFFCIMTSFALLAFFTKGTSDQALLLIAVLFSVGLLLPVVYFCSYFLSVNTQIKKMNLTEPRYAYTLTLTSQAFSAMLNDEKTIYQWSEIHAVYKKPHCIYLYVSPQRAYLLPADQVDSDALWDMLKEVVPASSLL